MDRANQAEPSLTHDAAPASQDVSGRGRRIRLTYAVGLTVSCVPLILGWNLWYGRQGIRVVVVVLAMCWGVAAINQIWPRWLGKSLSQFHVLQLQMLVRLCLTAAGGFLILAAWPEASRYNARLAIALSFLAVLATESTASVLVVRSGKQRRPQF